MTNVVDHQYGNWSEKIANLGHATYGNMEKYPVFYVVIQDFAGKLGIVHVTNKFK